MIWNVTTATSGERSNWVSTDINAIRSVRFRLNNSG